MKKLVLMTALAVGFLTSCSEDEDFVQSTVDNTTIAFATQSAKKAMTRSGATVSSLDKFTVSAVDNENTPYFSGVQFNYNDAAGVFLSATPYYWPSSGSLSFYAISNPGAVTLNDRNVPMYRYTDWQGEDDLVAATVQTGEKTIPYPLTFQHVLSQVSISVEAFDKKEQLTYKLTSVEMEAPCTGTYSFAEETAGFGSWDIDNSSSKTYSFADGLPLTFSQDGTLSCSNVYWNILPVKDGKITFKVGYQVFQNGQMIAEYGGATAKRCEVGSPNLMSGKRYIYNLQLTRGTEDAITFTTSVNDWDSQASSTDITVTDPRLTYVKYTDGTVRTFDLSGVIESTEESPYLRPADIIDNVKNAVDIRIGNQVTELGYKSFAGCTKLQRMDIPSSVTKLGTYALADCRALKELNLSEGLEDIGEKCFAYQNSNWCGGAFSHIDLPTSLTHIGEHAFAGSIFLNEIEIPEGVTIDQNAFYACNNLETVVISENCTLGSNAFRQKERTRWNDNFTDAVTKLKTVEFKGKVTFEGYAVFYNCLNLTTIKYNSTEVPKFGSAILSGERNAWSSTNSLYALGANYRDSGTNEFLVPANAIYTEADLDVLTPMLFNPEYCGFTLKKVL